MKYKFRFSGRTIGSIGKTRVMSCVVTGETQEDAMMKLYEKYDHITVISVREVIDG
jgi:hypothetical protein